MVAVRIENRAQLIYLLTEAAELEHNVLVCYLFALFSLKADASEGLTQPQLASVRSWRGTISEIAVQEMLHLASACNLLTAVGGAPQLRRPNLPTSPKAYPAAFKLRLVPFNLEAVEQFVFLERPEGPNVDSGESRRQAPAPLPDIKLSDIFSNERDYETLGELYRGIEDGLKYLAQKHGESGLFIGRPDAQTADAYFGLPGLSPVRDLSSALAALRTIIEQGEGASIDATDSHYRRFLKIREEYRQLLAEDAAFRPGRPVVVSPYALLPVDLAIGSEVGLLDHPLSVNVVNLFDGCYELMVQMLGRLFVHAEESEAELKTFADTTVGLMNEVIEPLGCAITALPAGPSHPGLNAGPSFRLSRGATIPTQRETALFIFRERLAELAAYCQFLQADAGAPVVLARVRGALLRFAAALAKA